ncbi:hypothetical protein OIY81_549, partial [Cryptosporidium canis]
KDGLSSALNGGAKPSIPVNGNIKMPPKKDSPTIPLKTSKNQGVVKNDQIVPPKNDDLSSKFNGEAKPSIPVKGNLMIPPKKGSSLAAFNGEVKPSIPVKGNPMMPPKKEAPTIPLKKVKTPGPLKTSPNVQLKKSS